MARSRVEQGTSVQIVSVVNSLRRVVRALRAMAQVAEDVLGISGAQHFVLQRLAEAPALSLNDLAARTMTHKSSVSVVVKHLVERGYVLRQRSSADRRGIVLTLTPAGRRAVGRAPQSAQTRMIAALRRFPRRELAAFAGLFERFTVELGVGSLEPTMLFEEQADGRRDGPRRPVRRTYSGKKDRRGEETRAKGR